MQPVLPARRAAARRSSWFLLLLALACLWGAAPSLGLLPGWIAGTPLAAWTARPVELGLDLAGGLELVFEARPGTGSPTPTHRVEEAAEVLRHRLDLYGVPLATVVREGAERIRVQVPGREAARLDRLRTAMTRTDLLTLHEVLAAAPDPLSLPADIPGLRVQGAPPVEAPESRPDRSTPGTVEAPDRDAGPAPEADTAAWYLLRTEPVLSGADLASARIDFDPLTGSPGIALATNETGRERLARATAALVGRPMAIVLGGRVYSAPVVEGPIRDGSARIRGSFPVEEARRLASLIEAGSLPVALAKVAEHRIEASLGADGVARTSRAAALGLVGVVAYVIAAYGRRGAAAGLGLALNLGLVVTTMQATGAVLTLPGIAGLALSLGMAVDASILILERIREEEAAGVPLRTARSKGFGKAWSAILDSNLTTLLTAGALYLFGQGPVRGFAITLSLGVVASLVSAVWALRVLLEAGEAAGGQAA